MADVHGFEYTGLVELAAELQQLGVDQSEVKQAMGRIGIMVTDEAKRRAPAPVSGRLARSLTVDQASDLTRLTVSVGNNDVRYARNFHAQALGLSKGGFTFRVPSHTRRRPTPHTVRAYTAARYIPNNPFLLAAVFATEKKVEAAFQQAVSAMVDQVSN